MRGKRMVGIGMDYWPMSKSAVRWVIDNFVVKGDQIILIHVLSSKSVSPQKELWNDKGSPLIPLDEFREMNLSKQYGITADPEVLQILDAASKVTMVSKVYWGDPREKLCDAVEDLKLDSLVVGSRGLGSFKRVLLGSVIMEVNGSQYKVDCLGLGNEQWVQARGMVPVAHGKLCQPPPYLT